MAVINHQPWKLAAAILLSLYILSLTEAATLPRGKGFSLKLVHPDSPNSPFYRRNLTDTQHSKRLLNSSISNARYLNPKKPTNTNSTTTTTYSGPRPRPRLAQPEKNKHTFAVEVGIGSGIGYQNYKLEFDTGSSLTWTQCAGCSPYFTQEPPMFDPDKSTTYSLLPGTHNICGEEDEDVEYKRKGDKCIFDIEYADQSVVSGDLANDTFTFQTAEAGIILFPQMIFGCATKSSVTSHNGEGILGMGASEESFAVQLAPYTDKRFSYCFLPSIFRSGFEGFLRFGDDIVMREPFQKTPISIFPGEDDSYFLDLLDISFDGDRIGIPRQMFQRRSNGEGGVIIDTGCELSYLTPEAYELVKKFMAKYFKSRGFTKVRFTGREQLCYVFKDNMGLYDLPGMTFHFKPAEGSADADLRIKGLNVFQEYEVNPARKAFCWEMLENSEDETILGAYQQIDTRFTYDLNKMELQFAPEDCVMDAI